ncbi:hypothetical protein N2152v2_002136 [Parachlorella kessleri]
MTQSNNMQSVLETNDLDELMNMASLAGRDFTAEKQHVIVISTGAVAHVDQERREAERRAAEDKHRHRLRLPRRPAWSASTSPDELDENERSAFYEWRRDLAGLEQEEHLVLTPFEKNLEVWRQLWRVLERSDIVVQVLDSRDPLTYRSQDLERYARELHPTKRSLLLLNKADLLPAELRRAWADYFDAQGLDYVFWSAKAATEEQQEDGLWAAKRQRQQQGGDPRARVVGVDELLDFFEEKAQEAVDEAEAKGVARVSNPFCLNYVNPVVPWRKAQEAVDEAEAKGVARASRSDRLMVGLIGYPNVGKSSTINALFGAKKTAVAPTPGKTKHFQTLNVSDRLCLCDCPGLVLPQYAHSKAEMVAAGVIPIDRLTDYRGPLETVAQRIPRAQLEAVYGLRLPMPAADQDPDRPPTPQELLRAFALSRGWVGPSGLPDETRCSRRILKDYVDGKLLFCKPPPGSGLDPYTGKPPAQQAQQHGHAQQTQQVQRQLGGPSAGNATEHSGQHGSGGGPAGAAAHLGGAPEGVRKGGDGGTASSHDEGLSGSDAEGAEVLEAEADVGDLRLNAADLDLLEGMELPGLGGGGSGTGATKPKPQRAEHKYHKKAARSKGDRGQAKDAASVGYDGASLPMGKRGGIVRVAGY